MEHNAYKDIFINQIINRYLHVYLTKKVLHMFSNIKNLSKENIFCKLFINHRSVEKIYENKNKENKKK